MKYARGSSASIWLSSLAANEDGVNWPELYAMLSSAAVHMLPVLSSFASLVADAIPAGQKSNMGQHSHVAILQLVTSSQAGMQGMG